jgi:hypothetical protein
MDIWFREGGRSRTIYLSVYISAFWLTLALLTTAYYWLRAWLKTDAMRSAEILGIALMLSVMWFWIVLIIMASIAQSSGR